MTGRSLSTSQHGIALAKRALLRKSLTQKAIANELGIASWSTVSKFFNGKPVDRILFMEICHALDLDWSAVVNTPEEDEPAAPVEAESAAASTDESNQLLQATQQQAAIARDALTPRILERIPREVVRQKYLPAIAKGVDDGQPHIIPIIGPAGYGKSTILGDLYDELTAMGTAWVGLVLCSTLSLSRDYMAFTSYSMVAATMAIPPGMATRPTGPTSTQEALIKSGFGKSLCGNSRPVAEVVAKLTQANGRGVLLIDTLDLVINRDFVISFGEILRELLAAGVTVVFTCRDREYSDYLEPTREKLLGLSHAIYRYTVPNFSTAEIRQAAAAFFRKLALPGQDQTFADNILNLSADNRSLQEIIENPLLLALLCELFAAEGNVPPDLTVSKLYQRYWQEKVAYTRLDRSDAQLLALEKERLCLTMAERLFERSQERLYESIYRDELGVSFTEILLDAYNDLLSEGVLAFLPSTKVHFFHQTLLEYAIAYWLTRHSAQSQRQQLFARLNQPDDSLNNTYWLPVLRQLLTILDTEAEFEQLVGQLNQADIGLFGVICMAAASRDSPDALRGLLPTALMLGEAYQKRLRQAFSVASRQLIEDVWDILLHLLETAPHATAGNTAQLVGELMGRWWLALRARLPEAVGAIARRAPDPAAPSTFSEGDGALLSGWLLQDALARMAEQPDADTLIALHSYLSVLGYRTLGALLPLHEVAQAPIEPQWALLETMLQDPLAKHEAVGRGLSTWLTYLLQQSGGMTPTLLGRSWQEILHSEQPQGWSKVQAIAVGRWSVVNPGVLSLMLEALMYGPPRRLQQNLHALTACLEAGGIAQLLQAIKAAPVREIPQKNMYVFSKLLNRCARTLPASQRDDFVSWLEPLAAQHIEDLYVTFDTLADYSPHARMLLEQHAPQCSKKKQSEIRSRLLRFMPIDQHPPLASLDKNSQRVLIAFYRQRAQDPEARRRLLQAAELPIKDVALAASKDIASALDSSLTAADMLPLLRSPIVGVRTNGITALIDYIEQGRAVEPLELEQVCQTLVEEDNQTVVRLLFQLINLSARQQPVTSPMLQALSTLPPRLVAAKQFEGGTARSLLDALKAITQSSTPPASRVPVEVSEYLLTAINLGQLRNGESEMIDLLCAVCRMEPGFLTRMAEWHGSAFAERGWTYNLMAIVRAAGRVEGKESALVEQILAAEWCDERVRGLALETLGH